MQTVEDRLLTRNDLRQFLEMILSAICDRLQLNGACMIVINGDELEQVSQVGVVDGLDLSEKGELSKLGQDKNISQDFIKLKKLTAIPVKDGRFSGETDLLGFIVVDGEFKEDLFIEQKSSLDILRSRAGLGAKGSDHPGTNLPHPGNFNSANGINSAIAGCRALQPEWHFDRGYTIGERKHRQLGKGCSRSLLGGTQIDR